MELLVHRIPSCWAMYVAYVRFEREATYVTAFFDLFRSGDLDQADVPSALWLCFTPHVSRNRRVGSYIEHERDDQQKVLP